jgi:intraflagellar transport protein 140
MSLFFDSHYLFEVGEKALMTSWSHSDFNMILAVATD